VWKALFGSSSIIYHSGAKLMCNYTAREVKTTDHTMNLQPLQLIPFLEFNNSTITLN